MASKGKTKVGAQYPSLISLYKARGNTNPTGQFRLLTYNWIGVIEGFLYYSSATLRLAKRIRESALVASQVKSIMTTGKLLKVNNCSIVMLSQHSSGDQSAPATCSSLNYDGALVVRTLVRKCCRLSFMRELYPLASR